MSMNAHRTRKGSTSHASAMELALSAFSSMQLVTKFMHISTARFPRVDRNTKVAPGVSKAERPAREEPFGMEMPLAEGYLVLDMI